MDTRALTIIQEMLRSRGVKADTTEIVAKPMDETKMYTFAGVLIVFSEKSRITERELSHIFAFADENGFTNGMIIVTPSPPSDAVLRVIRERSAQREQSLVQLYDIHHLQFDITKHRKVPPHRILTDDQKQTVFKKFNILKPRDVMPWLDSQDAMAKWIGARPDDVIEILRHSESAGATPYYRFCVADVRDT